MCLEKGKVTTNEKKCSPAERDLILQVCNGEKTKDVGGNHSYAQYLIQELSYKNEEMVKFYPYYQYSNDYALLSDCEKVYIAGGNVYQISFILEVLMEGEGEVELIPVIGLTDENEITFLGKTYGKGSKFTLSGSSFFAATFRSYISLRVQTDTKVNWLTGPYSLTKVSNII